MKQPKYVVMLASPNVGLLLNSVCRSRTAAAILLADRKYNGQAFNGEFVVRVSRAYYMRWVRGAFRNGAWRIQN